MLFSRNRIRSNALFGFAGFAIPTLVLLVAYPILIHRLGLPAVGIYILATSLSGAIAFLDFGFSTATLKFIAEDVAAERLADAGEVIATSLAFYGILGIVGGTVLCLAAPWLASAFQVSPGIRDDAIQCFRIAGAQFGLFLLTTVFICLFKGLQRFGLSTLCLVLLSILTYGAAALAAHSGLPAVLTASFLANAAVFTISAALAVRICRNIGIPLLRSRPTVRTARRLTSFGAVTTLNSFAQLGLFQGQRYLAGILIGPAAVAIYQTGSMIPMRAHAAIASICELLFPIASGAGCKRDVRTLYLRMLLFSATVAGFLLAGLIAVSPRLLPLWLGPVTAASVLPLLPVFGAAAFFLALSAAPYYFAYGIGKPALNSAYSGLNIGLNLLFLAIFRLAGPLTLLNFGWAFALANAISVLAFHAALEWFVWRPLLTGLTQRRDQPVLHEF